MLDFVLNFLFPPVCVICDKFNKKWLCENCYKKIENLYKNKYEKKLNLLYIFEYKKLIRKLLINYKFNDKSYINNFFSNMILNNKFDCDFLVKYDIIIPVPLSEKRRKERGYNQSDLIAKNIAKKLNLEYKSDYLLKIKETKKQSSLKRDERKINIKNAYEFNKKYNIKDKKIILLDDIYTTGSTVEECTKVLMQKGAKKVLKLIIAKD